MTLRSMDRHGTSTLEIADPLEPRKLLPVRMAGSGPVSMLPDRPQPWKEFGFSLGFQGAAVITLLWVGILHPNVLTSPLRDYHAVRLVNTPHPVNHDPQPIRPIQPPPVAEVQPIWVKLPPVVAKSQHPDPPLAPRIESQTKIPIQPAAVIIPKEAVKTNVFSTGSSQAPTIERPPQQVQTGGFGDPRGVASQNNKNQPVTIARQGGFDLPSGEGYGNGAGGSKGKPGVIASSGFGDGVAIGNSANSTNLAVHSGGFGDAQVANSPKVTAKHDDAATHVKPAEILSKPVPAYTEEAKKLHIEGEVLLEVVFESSGSIRVVRVVHGLGHGLDEAAAKAAQQIRFNPAQKDGQPVDFTGMLHILFQLT